MIRFTPLLMFLVACTDTTFTTYDWDELTGLTDDGLPNGAPPSADGNELYGVPAAERLGRRLYFDAGLSRTGEIACDDCHHASYSGADVVPFSMGANGRPSDRNAPTIYNAGYRSSYSWFVRQNQLWRQIEAPLLKGFHDLTDRLIAEHVCSSYEADYAALTGEPCVADVEDEVADARVREVVTKVLAAYVHTLESRDSAFDRFMGSSFDEREPDCLSPAAVRGAKLFVGKASCDECHNGPTLSDGDHYFIGVSTSDQGDVPTDELEPYQTAPLRQIGATGPYMHDGSFETLWEVLDFYRDGGSETRAGKAVEIQPLTLTNEDLLDLESFLVSLGGAPLEYCWVHDDPECCSSDGDAIANPSAACLSRIQQEDVCR